MAAETLKTVLSRLEIESENSFPSAQYLSEKITELKHLNFTNHKQMQKLLQIEVLKKY